MADFDLLARTANEVGPVHVYAHTRNLRLPYDARNLRKPSDVRLSMCFFRLSGRVAPTHRLRVCARPYITGVIIDDCPTISLRKPDGLPTFTRRLPYARARLWGIDMLSGGFVID